MAVMKHPPRGAVRQEECMAAGAEILGHNDLQEGSRGRRLALSKRSPIFSGWNGATMVKTLREKKPIRRTACKLYSKLRDALFETSPTHAQLSVKQLPVTHAIVRNFNSLTGQTWVEVFLVLSLVLYMDQ